MHSFCEDNAGVGVYVCARVCGGAVGRFCGLERGYYKNPANGLDVGYTKLKKGNKSVGACSIE